jgi:hypothetical protein
MPKHFTIEQAGRLIPRLQELVRDAMARNAGYRDAERAIVSSTGRIVMMGGMTVDRASAIDARARRDSAATQLRESLDAIQQLGCLVKDLEVGLADFPTLYRGREVFLCWKLGETAIGFWHGEDEGFAGRKPIDRDFLEHHGGESD